MIVSSVEAFKDPTLLSNQTPGCLVVAVHKVPTECAITFAILSLWGPASAQNEASSRGHNSGLPDSWSGLAWVSWQSRQAKVGGLVGFWPRYSGANMVTSRYGSAKKAGWTCKKFQGNSIKLGIMWDTLSKIWGP